MCLLFCFVVFWILCCVVCEKINKKLLITKKKNLGCIVRSMQKLVNDALIVVPSPFSDVIE